MASTKQSQSKYQTREDETEVYKRIKHIYIPMRDGIELCADLFLPASLSQTGGKAPVICSLGPYGKDIHASEFGLPKTDIYANMYKHIKPLGPDACFEMIEPLLWTKDYGYAILRVDERGIGGSQGRLDPFGLERSVQIGADAEGQDLYDIVEWAGTQPWSTGKVALAGISYYGMVGYWAAMQQPPHLTCVLSYESACNMYQAARRGGIYSQNFQGHWFNNIVVPYQSGKSIGDDDNESYVASRADYTRILAETEYPDEGVWDVFAKHRRLTDIKVPFYIAGNWTDPELHLPGNILAFNNISSKEKWLEMHTGNHLGAFYEPDHIEYEKKFLDYYLFDKKDNGMMDVPQIRLLQREGREHFYREAETAFPPPDVEETILWRSPSKKLTTLKPDSKQEAFRYAGLEGNIHFEIDTPFSDSFEILGSPYLELEVSTQAKDMDLFIYLRAINTEGNVIVLDGNHGEPMDSFARGYFRLSHRDEIHRGFREQNKVIHQPPVPRSSVVQGEVYHVTVPLYPTAYMFRKGERLSLEIVAQNTKTTIPPMRHDGADRTPERFGGENVVMSHGRLVLPRVRR